MSDFSGVHAELRSVARDLLSRYNPMSVGGGSATEVDWAKIGDAGWLGLEVAEPLDGAGATFAEVAVVLGEMGRAATASSYLGSTVLGIGALNRLEARPETDDLLRSAASGRLRLAVGLSAGEDLEVSPIPFTLMVSGSGWALSGEAGFVPDAAEADRLLLLARGPDDEIRVVGLDRTTPGLHVSRQAVIDQSRSLAAIRADGAPVEDAAVWRFVGDGSEEAHRLQDRGALALACDSLGLAETMLETTVSYARVRHQFGRPIGSFQAVKHACADMFVQVSICRELVREAVDAVCRSTADAWVPVSQAKAHVCQAAVEVAGKAMQLHGGIGYTWESGLHCFLKRAALNRSLFGSPRAHRARLASRYVPGAGEDPLALS